MKKILMLGGSAQQVVAIETAKRLGYYTVLCDFLPDNPGQYASDKFYLASTTDKALMLEIARKERVDGVVAYASDPAAPTAAYIAEQLGLPSNPYESVEILCNKDKFRSFLASNVFATPTAAGYTDTETALADQTRFTLPVIVKPVDSSGSKGATVIWTWEFFRDALEFAFSFSRGKRVIVEEFIEKKHPYLIGGDLFIWEGKVIMWGLMNCHRDQCVNSLVPVGKSYPPQLSQEDLAMAMKTLQTLIDKLNIWSGAMNVELVIDKNDRVWLIDVGPRNGGNMIPDLLGNIFGVDVVEMTILSAMGEPPYTKVREGTPYYATHNLHSARDGRFAGVRYSEEIKPYIIRECIYKKQGDPVEYFDNAAKALGIVFFKFDSEETMQRLLGNVNMHIEILLEEDTQEEV